VNGDGFLERKKGYSFMNHEERMEIISGIEGVDFVVGWDDGSQTVVGAIDILKPNYFTKGGDRTSADNVPEFKICEKIKCEVIFNVGGGKIQSSSELVDKANSAEANEIIGYAIGYQDGEKNARK
jgi:D-beta-D-heptose 7-phosphate kinase/D-beta-D-heptose 1-phosphate adenosyltransferase